MHFPLSSRNGRADVRRTFIQPNSQHKFVISRAVRSAREIHQDIAYGWNPERVRHDGSEADILAKAQQGAQFLCGTFSRLCALRCAAGEAELQWVDPETPELTVHHNTPLEHTTGSVRPCLHARELYPSAI